MINRRVSPYIIGVCIVAVLSIFYIGIRAYKGQVELDELLSDARAVNSSVGARHSRSLDNHAHEREGDALTTTPPHGHNQSAGHEGRSFEIDGMSLHVKDVIAPMPMSRDELESAEWMVYGKLTPYIEKEIKRTELLRQQNEGKVLQKVITPDGQIGTVAVDKDDPIKDGDAILRSDLITRSHPWGFSMDQVKAKRSEEYYTLDEYERNEYFKKFRLTLDLDVSMDEVEAKIAAGELDASLTDAEKKQIETRLSIHAALLEEKKHRAGLLDPLGPKPTVSDKPPVKVAIKPDAEYGHALPEGRSQNDDDRFWESVFAEIEAASDESSSTSDVVSEQPQSKSQVDRDLDLSFARSSEEAEDVPPMPDSLTPETIKAQLKERLSPEQFSKAQRLLDEYGAEEGLRQFKEMPPDHTGARNSHKKP